MKKLLQLIGTIFTIFIIGIILAKLRVKQKYLYLIVLGAISIPLAIGFTTILMSIIGFKDVGGNLYFVLYKYSVFFIVSSLLFIFLLDKVVMSIQRGFSVNDPEKINTLKILFSFLSGSSLIVYFFIAPDLLATFSGVIILVWVIVFSLKSDKSDNGGNSIKSDASSRISSYNYKKDSFKGKGYKI